MQPTIFITGCDRGVGAALAGLCADRGARVFAGVLDAALAGAEEKPSGGFLQRLVLDVTDESSVTDAAAVVREAAGSVDIIVNNAALLGDIDATLFDTVDFDEMLSVYNVNALGSLRVTQAFLPLLLAGTRKLVVNVSSEAGSLGHCTRSAWYAYAMAKAAVNMQSCLVHNLLRGHGGRALVVHPGHVRTFMRGHEDLTASLSPDEAALGVWNNIERASEGGAQPDFRGPRGELLPW